MTTLTITIEPYALEAANLEAARRRVTLDHLAAASLCGFVSASPTDEDNRALLELMYRGPLGSIDRPLTREEIYAERSWPCS